MAIAMQHDRDVVSQALAQVELPVDTQNMLVQGITVIVPKHGESQTVIQAELTRIAREALSGVVQTASKRVAACNADVATIDAQMASRQAMYADMDQKNSAVQSLLAVRMEELTAASAAVAAHESNRTEAESVFAQMTQERHDLQTLRDAAASMLNGSFAVLHQGLWEDGSSQDAALEELLQYLQDNQAEKALIASARSALSSKPESRTEFDLITVSEVSEVLQAIVSRNEGNLAASEPATNYARAEALGLWAIADVARDAEGVARHALVEAENEAKVLAAQQIELYSTQCEVEKSKAHAVQQLQVAQESVSAAEGALAALERLAIGYVETVPTVETEAPASSDDVVMGEADTTAAMPVDEVVVETRNEVAMSKVDLVKEAPVPEEVALGAVAQMGA